MTRIAAIGLSVCFGTVGVACGGGDTVLRDAATGGSTDSTGGSGGSSDTNTGGDAGSLASVGGGGATEAPGGTAACADGTEGCRCYGNGTCNDGLVCIDDACSEEGGSGGIGGVGGDSSTGGDSNTGGESVTGGDSSTGGKSPAGGDSSTGGDTSIGGDSNTGGDSPTGGDSNTGGAAGEAPCPDGTEGCTCYGNGTCNAGLECQSDVCTEISQPVGCTPQTMIDDMEDGDGGICENQGRSGGWWTFNNSNSGTIDPPQGTVVQGIALGSLARDGSDYGILFSGSGFGNANADNAVVAVSLNSGDAYNATVHRALVFWARASAQLTIRVDFSTNASNDVSEGGSCVPTSTLPCYDHHGTYRTIGTEWQQYWINLNSSTLEQEGWGVDVDLDLANLLNIHFLYKGDGVDGSSSFDNPSSFVLYLDDLSFED